ncbi:helix-turn-helix transcriptional regulator [Mucilaginibacter sp. BJC16-A38]|uniref:helix-turn-helix domain-containing protein n=1 Tax=Mucilaginibacter phenanthrenivorans TaxID=1234842 RepID=UPI002157C8F7|nr:helix-turn-helix transcriptional regulator [Mucilaginibacter phenanthrenivorans]MCR8559280.1 helix-turn-helix transcriptional regulator [Mucilaginibacter phenanthrenivorans]
MIPNKILLHKLGLRIEEVRKEKALTQLQLGEAIGKPIKYIKRLEDGNFDVPAVDLIALSKALGMTFSELMNFEI